MRKPSRPPTLVENIITAVISISLLTPLDMIQTVIQLQEHPSFPQSSKFNSAEQVFEKILEKGVLALWTGLGLILAKTVIVQCGIALFSSFRTRFPWFKNLVSSLIVQALVHPLELATVYEISNIAFAKSSSSTNGFGYLSKVIQDQGITGIYAGFTAGVLWNICFRIISHLGFIFLLRYTNHTGTFLGQLGMWTTSIISCYPLDTLKKILIEDSYSSKPLYNGLSDCYSNLRQSTNLFAGLFLGVLKRIIDSVILTNVLPIVKEIFDEADRQESKTKTS